MKNQHSLLAINTLTPSDVHKLNKIGITSLEDVACLEPKKIQFITEKLNLLEGRIKYEYWVEQAQDYLGGYSYT